jgi:hypothetical protein
MRRAAHFSEQEGGPTACGYSSGYGAAIRFFLHHHLISSFTVYAACFSRPSCRRFVTLEHTHARMRSVVQSSERSKDEGLLGSSKQYALAPYLTPTMREG